MNNELTYFSRNSLAENIIQVASNGNPWLKTTIDGKIELFDVEEMYVRAEQKCPYAIGFKAVYEAGQQQVREEARECYPNEELGNLNHLAKALGDDLEKVKRERDALAAYQKELAKELQSCQNVLHMMAYCGQVTWAYSDDAKKVLDKSPQTSLAEVRARAVEEAIESVRWKYTYTHDAYKFFQQHAEEIRNGKDGEL